MQSIPTDQMFPDQAHFLRECRGKVQREKTGRSVAGGNQSWGPQQKVPIMGIANLGQRERAKQRIKKHPKATNLGIDGIRLKIKMKKKCSVELARRSIE